MTRISKTTGCTKAVKVKVKDQQPAKRPPPTQPDDDPYETGDIAAPERDRDDEQRGL
ncbi:MULTISPECIES: hypothetical protein [Rhodopseudomonas]|nr:MULTISPECIES: hypothetical protein [Rhodopseudomonas]MDF3814248.1 hypothetical protein [Rhodopseudomonas sp. BAL398]WOK16156.1 hypothetical protein RBJ75_18540 [Rhodopseudomonas sp. BAL398]